MKRFAAVHVRGGGIRRVTFEAIDAAEAQEIAEAWGIGIEGEAPDVGAVAPVIPEAFDLPTARRLLGNVSRATVYRWLLTGDLERVPDCGKVLITRRSIERRAGGKT